MFIVWLVLLVLLAVIEMATVAIVSVWFCFGVLVAMILSMMGFSVTIQVVAFVAVSTILLIFTSRSSKSSCSPKTSPPTPTGLSARRDRHFRDRQHARAGDGCRRGTEWSARSGDGTKIPKGEW
jgi:membrane protein implicated in regulation of membrane protease activity